MYPDVWLPMGPQESYDQCMTDNSPEQVGWTLRQLCAAGAGFAPGSIAGVRKVILSGRIFTLDDRFVPAADFEALRAEYERLAAEAVIAPDGQAVAPEP